MTSLPASLEDLISAKLAALGLQHDESTTSFVQGIVEEDSFEPEDKKDAILGVLEAEEGDEAMEKGVLELLAESTVYREALEERLRLEEEEKLAAKALEEAAAGKGKKVLTPEEELARKRALVKSYEFLEDQDEKERLAKAEADKPPTVVFQDPKLQSKKARKKADAGVDILMQPNINAAVVRGAELQRRQDDAAAAAKKRERDKGDMKKQKEDKEKKEADKKKKAQKVERRA